MRILKLALISIVILFAVVMGLSFLLPSHVRISRAININAAPGKVHSYISDLHKWKEWNVLVYQPATHDSVLAITGNSIQIDQLTITVAGITSDTIVTSWKELNRKPFSSVFSLLGSSNGQTTVQWYFDFHLEWYPWEKFQSIIYDKQMGPSMEASLSGLKNLVETSP